MSKHVLATVLSMVFLAGCTDSSPIRAIKTMESAGHTDVKVTQVSTFMTEGCGRGDSVAFDVTATNVLGKRVTAVVCCGDDKGCTVRY